MAKSSPVVNNRIRIHRKKCNRDKNGLRRGRTHATAGPSHCSVLKERGARRPPLSPDTQSNKYFGPSGLYYTSPNRRAQDPSAALALRRRQDNRPSCPAELAIVASAPGNATPTREIGHFVEPDRAVCARGLVVSKRPPALEVHTCLIHRGFLDTL